MIWRQKETGKSNINLKGRIRRIFATKEIIIYRQSEWTSDHVFLVWIRSSSFHKQNTEYQLEEVKLNWQIPPQHGQSQTIAPPSSGMSFLEPAFHEEIFPGQFLNESNQTDTNVKR